MEKLLGDSVATICSWSLRVKDLHGERRAILRKDDFELKQEIARSLTESLGTKVRVEGLEVGSVKILVRHRSRSILCADPPPPFCLKCVS